MYDIALTGGHSVTGVNLTKIDLHELRQAIKNNDTITVNINKQKVVINARQIVMIAEVIE